MSFTYAVLGAGRQGVAAAYDMIRFADKKRENWGIRTVIQPGLWLQRLTAREPSEGQIEVAIRALQEVLELERHH